MRRRPIYEQTRKVRMKRRPRSKKPYRKPQLKVHGDIRTLTGAKAGTKQDGAGKPSTKVSGPSA